LAEESPQIHFRLSLIGHHHKREILILPKGKMGMRGSIGGRKERGNLLCDKENTTTGQRLEFQTSASIIFSEEIVQAIKNEGCHHSLRMIVVNCISSVIENDEVPHLPPTLSTRRKAFFSQDFFSKRNFGRPHYTTTSAALAGTHQHSPTLTTLRSRSPPQQWQDVMIHEPLFFHPKVGAWFHFS